MTWDVPGYSVVRVLSEGPTGRVVQAVREGFGEQVVILDGVDVVPDDARLLTALRDRHVVHVRDYLEARPALVMEQVDGITLDRVVRESGPMAPEVALRVLRECLAGLVAAHRLGIVHRNLTPASVLMVGGVLKLTGFGIASPQTPGYTAPERWDGDFSPAGDLYAAAAVFQHCLTGEPPGERVVAPESLPADMRGLLARGMAGYAAARPRDAASYAGLVDAVMRGEWAPPGTPPAGFAPSGPPEPQGRSPLARPMAAVVAVGLVCGAGAFGLGTAFGDDEKKPAAKPGQTPRAQRSVPPGTGVTRGRMTFTINPTARVVGNAVKAASPTNRRRIDVAMVVSPAIVHAGNKVTVRLAEKRVDPSGCPPVVKRTWGWSVGDGKAGALWLYPRTAGRLPSRVSERRIEVTADKAAPRTAVRGCVRTTLLRSVYTFTVPEDGSVKPGAYLLSPLNPPRVARIYGARAGGNVELPLSEARATNAGRLPALTVR